MAEKRSETTIIVRELKHIQDGQTSTGGKYTLWQVRATKPDGIPIEQNLRSFEELALDVPLKVSVERFESDQFGVSYTVKSIKPKLSERVEMLEDTTKRLESELDALKAKVANLTAPPPPPPPPPPPAPPPADAFDPLVTAVDSTVATIRGDGTAGGTAVPDDDIPFAPSII